VRNCRGVEGSVLERAGQDALIGRGRILRIGENVGVQGRRAPDRNALQPAVTLRTLERVVVTGDDGAGQCVVDISGAVRGRRGMRRVLVCRLVLVTVLGYCMAVVMVVCLMGLLVVGVTFVRSVSRLLFTMGVTVVGTCPGPRCVHSASEEEQGSSEKGGKAQVRAGAQEHENGLL